MSMTEPAPTLPGVGSPLRLAPVTNLERMYALDEAWNARNWDTFDTYHEQSDVVVYWPGPKALPRRVAAIIAPSQSASAQRSPTTRSSTPTTSCSEMASSRRSSHG